MRIKCRCRRAHFGSLLHSGMWIKTPATWRQLQTWAIAGRQKNGRFENGHKTRCPPIPAPQAREDEPGKRRRLYAHKVAISRAPSR